MPSSFCNWVIQLACASVQPRFLPGSAVLLMYIHKDLSVTLAFGYVTVCAFGCTIVGSVFVASVYIKGGIGPGLVTVFGAVYGAGVSYLVTGLCRVAIPLATICRVGGSWGCVFVRNVVTGLMRALNIPTCLAIISIAVSSFSVCADFAIAFATSIDVLPLSFCSRVVGDVIRTSSLDCGCSLYVFSTPDELASSFCGRRSITFSDCYYFGVSSACVCWGLGAG